MKKYTNDYETIVTSDAHGRENRTIVYRGDYFEFKGDEESIAHFRRNSFLLLAIIVVAHISGGFVGNLGMYQFYVALPYVFAFFPLVYMAAGIFRLPKEKREYRRDEIGLSFDRMKSASFVLMVFFVIGALGEITFLLLVSVGEQCVLEFLYLALEALAATAVYFLIYLQRKIRVQICREQKQ